MSNQPAATPNPQELDNDDIDLLMELIVDLAILVRHDKLIRTEQETEHVLYLASLISKLDGMRGPKS